MEKQPHQNSRNATLEERLIQAVHDVVAAYVIDGIYPPMTIQQRNRLHREWQPLAKALDNLVNIGVEMGMNTTRQDHRINRQ